ncbi:MAG TPA: leucyl aminopeptidase [Actinomycetota bacterium]|nr:leucyl aminopeptidase [Actinomycetota bacterium]
MFSYSTDPPADARADLLVLPVLEGPEAGPGIREVKGADLLSLYTDAKLRGKRGEHLLIPDTGALGVRAGAVLLVGVGPRSSIDADALRRAIGKVAPQLAKRGSVVTTFPQAARRSHGEAVQATVEGILLGSYRFSRYKSGLDGPVETDALASVTLLGPSRWDSRAMKAAVRRAEVVSDAVAWARDLVNTPAIDCTPDRLAREAQAMAEETGLECTVWGEAELKEGGFGGILGVGAGSVNPPRMIELVYRGGGKTQAPIALTGKGISFDSGGLSIKTTEGMEWMKGDMGGAASILGAMKAIARLKPKVNVVAAIPSAENMPSGSAIRPGDVLHHRGGKTSEVMNTDAEGRLVLADSLAYLTEQQPRVIIDTATLTGACMVALGDELFGVMGNDRSLIRDLLAASEAAGEPAWELPLWPTYRRMLDSEVADFKNVGKRYGGAITAGLFLSQFVGDTPWVHLDIAGPAFAEKAQDYCPKGGTGVPVRTLVGYVLTQAGAGTSRR